jgi:hypothetical protein
LILWCKRHNEVLCWATFLPNGVTLEEDTRFWVYRGLQIYYPSGTKVRTVD